MSNFERTLLHATWTTGNYVTVKANWVSIDRKIAAGVNGDDGGAWAPRNPIFVAGEGIRSTVPVVVDYGGKLTARDGALFKVASGYPVLGENHVGRRRSILTSCLERKSRRNEYHWLLDERFTAIRSIACTVQHGMTDVFEQPRFILPLRVHDGSRLQSASLSFRINHPREQLPVETPKIRIVRVAFISGESIGEIQPLMSQAAGADKDGFVSFPMPNTPAAWYANGEAQEFVYVCDQNNDIDVSKYAYYAEVIEEVGTKTTVEPDGFIVRQLIEAPYAIPSSTVYGPNLIKKVFENDQIPHSPVTGLNEFDAVLIVGNTVAEARNGAWLISAGAGVGWTRMPWLMVGSQFVKNLLIMGPIETEIGSTRESRAVWECVYPVVNESIEPTQLAWQYGDPGNTLPKNAVRFQRRTPKGNTYHAVVCHFDNITDMRPQ